MVGKLAIPIAILAAAAAAFLSHAPEGRTKPLSAGAATAHGGPVLVELYQSQGCSSCPPANDNLNAIAGRPDVVALSFAVTYWDHLGWKDSFASPQFTQRQWDYARRNRRGNVATPQVWINGRTTIVGSDARQLASVIAGARHKGPTLVLSGNKVRVAAGEAPPGGADLWAATYDPRIIQVPVRAGENGGRTLPHKNVVRSLVLIGHWRGGAMTYDLPGRRPGLAAAVFLQAGRGGPVLAAAKGA